MRLRNLKWLMTVVVLLTMMLIGSPAYADYNPMLQSPADGATSQLPDGLACSWGAGSDTPEYYIVQWSLQSDFSELLFQYTTTETTYTIRGLPGFRTIYWRVIAVDSDNNQYPCASAFSFVTAPDGEVAAGLENITTPLTFSNNSLSQPGWTYEHYSSSNWRVYNSYSPTRPHLICYVNFSTYRNRHFYYRMTTPVTISGINPELYYKWSHYKSGSYTENLEIDVRIDGQTNWTKIYDHTAMNNASHYTAGYYYYGSATWAEMTIDLSSYYGKDIYIRFHIDTGSNCRYTWCLDDIVLRQNTTYEGTPRNVTISSAFGNYSPSGTIQNTYGDPFTAQMSSVYYFPPLSSNERYVYAGYTGTGSASSSGTEMTVSFKVYRTSTIVWNWHHEFIVSVTSPGDIGDPDPNGAAWQTVGTDVTYSVTTPVPGLVDGTRWVCTGFTGTGDFPLSGTTNSETITVTQHSTITWHWAIQYRLMIINPPGDAVGNIVPPAGSDYWYFEGGTQNVSADVFFDTGAGILYACDGWLGTGSVNDSDGTFGTVTISQPSTLTWVWGKNVFLEIHSAYGQVTGSPPGWYVEGSEASLGVQSPYDATPDTRYVITGWTGTGSVPASGNSTETGTFTMNVPSSIVWNWQRQFLVIFDANYGYVEPSSAWVDEGASVSAEAIPIPPTETKQFSWRGWNIGGQGALFGDIQQDFTITAPITYTANWFGQFLVTITARNGTNDGISGWKDEFSFVDVSAAPPSAADGERWVCGWDGTGNGSVTLEALPQTSTSVQLQVLEPIIQESYWVKQVRFTIMDPREVGNPIPPEGDYWYFIGDLVEGSVEFFTGVYKCIGFDGTGSLASSPLPWYSFNIDVPSTIVFIWDEEEIAPSKDWENARTVTSAIQGRNVELARRSDGSPFIAFHNPVSGTLEAAYALNDEWVTETVDTVGHGFIGISLVLDRFDVPFIAYYDGDDNVLKLASFVQGGWDTVVVDNTPGAGGWCSIAIASDGTIGIAYYVLSTGDLKYATMAPDANKLALTPNTEIVDEEGNVGLYCSLAFTPNWSEPRIAYYSSTDGCVKLASNFRDVGVWTIEQLNLEGGDFGTNTSLQLDPAGFALICFQENSIEVNQQGLVFARELPIGWQLYTLDSEGITGFDSVMKIDSRGYPHILYHDFGNLFYARYNGESWIITTLDTDEVGYETALALDGNDNPAVAYWADGILKYNDVTDNHYDGILVNRYTQLPYVEEGERETLGGGGCFIATAAFGTMSAGTVSHLCSIRDVGIGISGTGNRMISLYYAVSPAVAARTGLRPALCSVIRRFISR